LIHRAIESAERAQRKDVTAIYRADWALREATFGYTAEALSGATKTLKLSIGRGVQTAAALTLALAGDPVRAQAVAEDPAKRFPEDTDVHATVLPTVRIQLILNGNNNADVTEIVQRTTPYELELFDGLITTYVRGYAYVAAHRGTEAAAEFQKIVDHPGLVKCGTQGPLALLGLARAYALQGDTAKAKAAYQDFLTLWKDADPDIPIFIAAKAEYAKLQ
jgi:tetratricopeptide (TPR) repeat protein